MSGPGHYRAHSGGFAMPTPQHYPAGGGGGGSGAGGFLAPPSQSGGGGGGYYPPGGAAQDYHNNPYPRPNSAQGDYYSSPYPPPDPNSTPQAFSTRPPNGPGTVGLSAQGPESTSRGYKPYQVNQGGRGGGVHHASGGRPPPPPQASHQHHAYHASYGGRPPPPSGPPLGPNHHHAPHGGRPVHPRPFRIPPPSANGGIPASPMWQYPPSQTHNQRPPHPPTTYQPPKPSTQDPFFYQYSNCKGKKKALCIGINYGGTKQALAGCHNDVSNVRRFLIESYGYKRGDIVTLVDEKRARGREVPTRRNMIDAMKWLVKDAKPNDSLFFHYSGHGGQTKDKDGDEDDGYDEVIYPLDWKQSGHIVDDQLHDILVKSLPPGCRLTAIFDCCHSASALDLPYVYSTEGKVKEPNLLALAGTGALGAVGSYLRGDKKGALKGLMGTGQQLMGSNKADEISRKTKTSAADVISLSGCKDNQTSADTATAQGLATGAMSWALITALTKRPQQTYMQLLNGIRDELKGKYQQKPQLSASHPFDCNLPFVL